MPIDTIKIRNGLEDNTLKVGQLLHIGWMSLGGIENNTALTLQERMRMEFYKSKNAKRSYKAQGKTNWDKDSGKEGWFVLHRHAKKGSLVRIEDFQGNVIFAQVVDKLPANYPPDVIAFVSKDIAKYLKEYNKQFFIKIEYFK